MAYIEIAEIKTHLRPEIVDKITREDDTIVQNAIDSAILEAKSYLNKYDLDALFDDQADNYVTDQNLKNKVKDIAMWNLVKLANPNVNMAMARQGYEDALAWLDKIMKGQMDPQGWPLKTDTDDAGRTVGSSFYVNSNTKRENHW